MSHKTTIGFIAMAAIKAGHTDAEALRLVKRQFPESRTNLSSMSWYRSALRAKGCRVPTTGEMLANVADTVSILQLERQRNQALRALVDAEVALDEAKRRRLAM